MPKPKSNVNAKKLIKIPRVKPTQPKTDNNAFNKPVTKQ